MRLRPASFLEGNHTAIRVPEFDTAIAWYADKLAFRSKQVASVAGLSFGFLYPTGGDSFHFDLMAGQSTEATIEKHSPA